MTNDIVVAKVELNVPAVEVDGPALLIGEMDRAGFEELGLKLKSIQGHTVLWWGDWGNAFKKQHGWGSVTEVAELLDMSDKYIGDCMRTAEEYDSTVRTVYLEQGLSASHLLEARTAPTPTFALDRAAEEEMSVRELRAAIRKMKPEGDPKESTTFSWIKDPRVIKAQLALADIRRAIVDLQKTTEDHAVAAILLEDLYNALLAMVEDHFDV